MWANEGAAVAEETCCVVPALRIRELWALPLLSEEQEVDQEKVGLRLLVQERARF